MLPHYSPLKVAESFSVLSGLFPGRIDLALGRAPGTDALTTFALQRDRRQARPTTSPSSSPSCSRTWRTACPRSIRSRGSRRRCRAARTRPSRGCSAPRRRARCGRRELGLPLRVRRLHQPATAPRSRALYRERFIDRRACRAPQLAVAVWALCADSRRGGRAPRRERAVAIAQAAPGRADRGAAARRGACASSSAASATARGSRGDAAAPCRDAREGARRARAGRGRRTAPAR